MPDLIIHGHFYQPPREDPWIEEIEGEPSAAPYANWNERIHAQCYRPNANSRILGEFGRIREIVNNYRHLSFNFGPTLLSWMREADPETLAALVSADQESMIRNNGHGNAIAQGYNHIIMPLADYHDKETQILWGLADFRFRFGREPESMWMPETAVDLETLDLLVAHGMKYVILSPYQAAEIEGANGSMNRVIDPKFDTGRPYWIETSSSTPDAPVRIAAFFYHASLSSDISFNHLLRSSELFTDRIVAAAAGSSLLNIATDGEIYGHHEPFGDMGLAHALNKELPGETGRVKMPFRVTNYGAHLETHPPTLSATLKSGGTSWSCAHGVERWRSDCGCRINQGGGWNQRWRAPLREALDQLRDALRKTFEQKGAKCFKDPWGARNDYINVILSEFDEETKSEFAHRWFKRTDDVTVPWRLLESQRNAMLMFTSCGWFFDDISGIEPRQLMLYASRAIDALGDLAPSGVEEKFVAKLAEAKSNDPAIGDGEKIYRAIAHPRTTAKLRILNQAILSNYAGIKPHGRTRYATGFSGEAFWESDDLRLGRGTAKVRDLRTEVEKRYAWVGLFTSHPHSLVFDVGATFRWPGGDPRGKKWEEIRPAIAARKGTVILGVRDLFKSEARMMVQEELRKADGDLDLLFTEAIAVIEPPLLLAASINIVPDPSYSLTLSLMADFLWASLIRNGRRDEARRLKHRIERLGLAISKQSISSVFSAQIDRLAEPLKNVGRMSSEFNVLLDALRNAQEDGVVVEAQRAQEAVYALLKGEGSAMIGEILEKNDVATYQKLLGLFEAAERLYIDVSSEKKLIEPFERAFANDPKYWP